MSTDNQTIVASTTEALCSFLTTLLDAEAPLQIDEPRPVTFDEASVRSKSNIVLTAGSSAENRWAVVLDPAWLPLLSKSMLGDPIAYGEPGADDLLKELSTQAYGAVRTQLSSANIILPEAQIELLGQADELVGGKFSPAILEVRFQMASGDQELAGFALIPAPQAAPNDGEETRPVDSPKAAPMGSQSGQSSQSGRSSQSGQSSQSGRSSQSGQSRPGVVEVATAAFPELGNEIVSGDGSDAGFALLAEVELEVTVELGRRKIPLADVLRLTTGSVIELDKLVGEPLEVYANGRLIAEGEAVVMDEQFGIRITSLSSIRQRAKSRV